MFFENFCNAIGGVASFVCTTIGAVANSVSLLPIPMPTWAKVTLKVVGIAAPVIGGIISTVKYFKNKKKSTTPRTTTEYILSNNKEPDEIDESDLNAYQTLVDDHDNAIEEVSEEIRYLEDDKKSKCAKRSKFRIKNILRRRESKKSEEETSEKATKKSVKGSTKVKADNKKEVKPVYKFRTITQIANGKRNFECFNKDEDDYDIYEREWYRNHNFNNVSHVSIA